MLETVLSTEEGAQRRQVYASVPQRSRTPQSHLHVGFEVAAEHGLAQLNRLQHGEIYLGEG